MDWTYLLTIFLATIWIVLSAHWFQGYLLWKDHLRRNFPAKKAEKSNTEKSNKDNSPIITKFEFTKIELEIENLSNEMNLMRQQMIRIERQIDRLFAPVFPE